MKRFRYHGTPTDPVQPDVGDVLYVAEWHPTIGPHEAGPILAGPIYRVHAARQLLRGPNAGKAHELALVVEPESVAVLGDPDVTYWPVKLDRGERA